MKQVKQHSKRNVLFGNKEIRALSLGEVMAIDDLFRESPLRSLGPRYTFIYRGYL